MSNTHITVRGARVHNLKNIDVTIPRDKLVVFTGLSGSGKSSLAFDTIYAEGHRRFVESLSSYARQFLGQLDKPDIDGIEGLSPAISIDQKTTSKNPRSTVGTVTEIYDYLRLLYARVGVPHCHVCGKEIARRTTDSIIDEIMGSVEGEPSDTHPIQPEERFMILAPVVRQKKGTHEKVFEDARRSGYARVRVNGSIYDLSETTELDKNKKHTVEVVVDRLVMREDIRPRLTGSIETALNLSGGSLLIVVLDGEGQTRAEHSYSQNFACEEHGVSFMELSPRIFSFNNPMGACESCDGLGETKVISPEKVIPDTSLSLSQAAINVNGYKTITETSWYGPVLQEVGKKYGFTIDTPIADFNEEALKVLHWGSREIFHVLRPGHKRTQPMRFGGFFNDITRQYREGKNDYYDDFFDHLPCPDCTGSRLKPEVLAVKVGDMNINQVCCQPISKALEFFEGLKLSPSDSKIAKEILTEIRSRLGFLISVGLDYITLIRRSGTLSGGEAQRIRLATQIGSSLMGVLYILDEPSIGLHQRDNQKLIGTLKKLRDTGNSVIVVEHDEETILASDYVLDIGPGAGIHGGVVVAQGTPQELMADENSVTGPWLSGKKRIMPPKERRAGNGEFLRITGAEHNNLKGVDVAIPLGTMTLVTGVSGSGKSSLVNGILHPALAKQLNGAHSVAGKHGEITGVEHLDKVIAIDQSPIGRTPR
ncbi:MAG: excinuclease ABC subunit UvrA, partial [Oscillospiraceae bacterium]|nr:excinuclease ABC subunit UvrA [Oscillospiraceae bacterium]